MTISLLDIFISFLKIGAIAFGGAYAGLPLVEQEVVVARGWMTMAEFGDLVALDELTPGPILINSATFVGVKLAGIPGAIVATFGVILPACIVSLALVMLFRKYSNLAPVESALLSLKCMALALICSTFVKIGGGVVFPGGFSLEGIRLVTIPIIAVAFYLLNVKKMTPLPIILSCGAINVILHLLAI